eukprot:TRINITY_DN526_c1_g1_i1.p1 TRINITY_DN526_c1_g1~~TRINITY_DN526_c1_g1_i1.p1  ORF type:complete len:319 (+),score=91.68 TRINITY_DN526_c1_g1_i1:80-958(+)
MPIDYSKWDNVGDSDDDAPPQKAPLPDHVVAAAARYAQDRTERDRVHRLSAADAAQPGEQPDQQRAAAALRTFRAMAEAQDGRLTAAVTSRLLRIICGFRGWVPRRLPGGVLQLHCGGSAEGGPIAPALGGALPAEVHLYADQAERAEGEADGYFSGELLTRFAQWAAATDVEFHAAAAASAGGDGAPSEPFAAALRCPHWRPALIRDAQGEGLMGHAGDGAVTLLTSPDHIPQERGQLVQAPGAHTIAALAEDGHTVGLSYGPPDSAGKLQWLRLAPAVAAAAVAQPPPQP